MKPGEFPTEVVDRKVYDSAVEHLRSAGVRLPTLEQLADPSKISPDVSGRVAGVDASASDPENLFRIQWFNGENGIGTVATPEFVVPRRELTGVDAPIDVALGDRFPMIGATMPSEHLIPTTMDVPHDQSIIQESRSSLGARMFDPRSNAEGAE